MTEKIKIKDYIKENEGLRLKPYKCTAGKLTIGIGRNLDDKGISENEADIMFEHDIEDSARSLIDIFSLNEFLILTRNRQIALIDMMFNLGKTRFSKFEKMIQSVKDRNFEEAAKQILDSRYARQVKNRANRNAKMME